MIVLIAYIRGNGKGLDVPYLKPKRSPRLDGSWKAIEGMISIKFTRGSCVRVLAVG